MFQIRTHIKAICGMLFLPLFLLVFSSGCGIKITDINFSSRPPKLTVEIPSERKVESFVAKSLPMGPESYLDVQAKVQKGVIPLSLSDAMYFKAHSGRINTIIPLGEDGLISGGDDGKILLSRLVEKNGALQFLSESLLIGSKPIQALSLSPDKRYLAIAQTSLVTVYDIKERQFAYILSRIHGRITSLTWDPRGELIALGLAGGDVYIWSLKQSFFGGQGKDSFDSLEHYLGGESPIVALVFHPSGGAFLSAELEGQLSVWRALRTEEELGLRDKFNVDDQEALGTTRQIFANMGAFITDTYLTPDGKYFFASAASGKLSFWKIRGLVGEVDSTVSKESLLSFTSLRANLPALRGKPLILTATQDQKLQILCLKKTISSSQSSLEYILLAESPPLRETFGRLRAGAEGGLIWGAEKSDALVVMKRSTLANELLASPRLKECTGE